MTTVQNAVMGVSKLGVDTAPLIYFIEKHPSYLNVVREILRYVDGRTIQGYSASITLTEVLTFPKRTQNYSLAQTYERYLRRSRNFTLVPITPDIAELAADMRAKYGLKTPDALQIAAALSVECEAFLTNDKGLQGIRELSVIVVDDLIS